MTEEVEKYLWDIKLTIDDIYSFEHEIKSFEQLEKEAKYRFAIERGFEIIGEALKRIRNEDLTIKITDSDKIIGLRNIVAHEYDKIDTEQLWKFVKHNLPLLRKEIENLINQFPPINPEV